jgi:hypothetical protein
MSANYRQRQMVASGEKTHSGAEKDSLLAREKKLSRMENNYSGSRDF